MKASIKFRDEQTPLLRAKIPLNILNFPFQSGISAGDYNELSLNLCTFFDSGPSFKFSYRPNDSQKPFSFNFKTGISHFGSPNKSPLTMSAEFNLIGNQNPSFFIHFKPNFGDFSIKKSNSSSIVKDLGVKLNGDVLNGENFVNNRYFKSTGFFPAMVEPKAATGMVLDRVVKGTEISAKTAMPLRDFAVVNFRWGLRVPPQEAAADDENTAMVSKADWTAGIRLPFLVMNKIGIEHVAKGDSKKEKVGPGDKLAETCLEVKKQVELIQAENGMLSKALSDLRSEIAAGKMDSWRSIGGNYSGDGVDRRGYGEKKSLEGNGGSMVV